MMDSIRELFWVPKEERKEQAAEVRSASGAKRRAVLQSGTEHSVRAFGSAFSPIAQMGMQLTSPNISVYEKLQVVRDLSRFMCEQDPYLSKYLELTSVMTVGDGIQPKVRVLEPKSGVELEQASLDIIEAWNEWCEEASADGRLGFADIEQAVIQAIARDGEAVVRMCRGREFRHGFALQVIDPVLLDHETNQINQENKNRVIMGVEVDQWGRDVAFHIWSAYAHDKILGRKRELLRIPAEDILHIREDSTLAGSTRSLPWTYPALRDAVRLYELIDDYSAAIKLAARTRLALHREDEDDEEMEEPGDDILDESTANRVARSAPDPDFINTSQSQILEVAPGRRLEALNIQLPSQGFDEAVRKIEERIAGGLHVSYTTLMSDGSKESYSTVRHNSQTEREVWTQRNGMLIRLFHRKVFRAWLRQAILSGRVTLPGNLLASSVEVQWQTRGYSSIDIQKDVRSWVMAIENGLLSRQMVCAMSGHDYKEILKQIKEERDWQSEMGIVHPELQDELESLASALKDHKGA